MKKVLILIAIISSTVFAQNNSKNNSKSNSKSENESSGNSAFDKGFTLVNLGMGFGGYGYRASGINNYSYMPPITLSGDYAITKEFSIGAGFAYSRAKWEFTGTDYHNQGNGVGNYYTYTDTWKWSFYTIGLRGAYHLAEHIKSEKLDVYGGLFVGNTFAKSSYTSTDIYKDRAGSYNYSYGGFTYALFAGGRYMIKPNFGFYGEFSYGMSYLNAGITFKL